MAAHLHFCPYLPDSPHFVIADIFGITAIEGGNLFVLKA